MTSYKRVANFLVSLVAFAYRSPRYYARMSRRDMTAHSLSELLAVAVAVSIAYSLRMVAFAINWYIEQAPWYQRYWESLTTPEQGLEKALRFSVLACFSIGVYAFWRFGFLCVTICTWMMHRLSDTALEWLRIFWLPIGSVEMRMAGTELDELRGNVPQTEEPDDGVCPLPKTMSLERRYNINESWSRARGKQRGMTLAKLQGRLLRTKARLLMNTTDLRNDEPTRAVLNDLALQIMQDYCEVDKAFRPDHLANHVSRMMAYAMIPSPEEIDLREALNSPQISDLVEPQENE